MIYELHLTTVHTLNAFRVQMLLFILNTPYVDLFSSYVLKVQYTRTSFYKWM